MPGASILQVQGNARLTSDLALLSASKECLLLEDRHPQAFSFYLKFNLLVQETICFAPSHLKIAKPLASCHMTEVPCEFGKCTLAKGVMQAMSLESEPPSSASFWLSKLQDRGRKHLTERCSN